MQLYADDPIRQIFANLDSWRHLPAYQLERRFDIFLTPYLRRIVEDAVQEPLSGAIVPEMPLKQQTSNRSENADYVLFSQDGAAAFVVALKTDCASVRAEQIECLARVAAKPWPQTLGDLIVLVLATRYRRKYIHLLKLLERAGQLRVDPGITEYCRAGGRVRFKSGYVSITTSVRRVVPVFITPRSVAGLTCITFADIRKTLGRIQDPLAPLLGRYLENWECDAGTIAPQEAAS